MYFTYLNLPKPPRNFLLSSRENLKLIGVDDRVNKLNEVRAINNRGTLISQELQDWLESQIYPKFQKDDVEILPTQLNITTYKDNNHEPAWRGSHGRHVDIGRTYAVNYYMETGGGSRAKGIDGTCIEWWSDLSPTSSLQARATPIIRHRWAILRVDKVHSVRHMHSDRLFLSFGINPLREDFDPLVEYKDLIDPDFVISATNPGI